MKLATWQILTLLIAPLAATGQTLTVKAVNPLAIARASQTLELSQHDLAGLNAKSLDLIHVKTDAGKEVLCQAVDIDGDDYHRPDAVIFQADFAPNETKIFTVSAGAKQHYTEGEFKAYGRFVRERFDDFAWENDRIAHRTYGKALETWKGEPLTSSAIDIWSKRTPRMVIDAWYMADNYHHDDGQGYDDYSCGPSRGCGGTGLWAANRLWVSHNFVGSRVLSNGPIRVLFELTYEAFDVDGASVTEVKRISLDAGSQLDHFQSFYKMSGGGSALIPAVGIKKATGEQKTFDASAGALVFWEPMEKNGGQQGLAVLVDPKAAAPKEAQDEQNHLLLLKPGADNSISYWAGFAWDKAGLINDSPAWQKYLAEFAQGLQSPIQVSVAEK